MNYTNITLLLVILFSVTLLFLPLLFSFLLEKHIGLIKPINILYLLLPSVLYYSILDNVSFLFFLIQNCIYLFVILDIDMNSNSSMPLFSNGNKVGSAGLGSKLSLLSLHWLSMIWLFTFSHLCQFSDQDGISFTKSINIDYLILFICFICLDLSSIIQISFIGDYNQGKGKLALFNPYLLFQSISTIFVWWGVILHNWELVTMLWFWKVGAGLGSFYLFYLYSNMILVTRYFIYVGVSTFSLAWCGVLAFSSSIYKELGSAGISIETSKEDLYFWLTFIPSLIFAIVYMYELSFINRKNRIVLNFTLSTFITANISYWALDLNVGPFLIVAEILFVLMVVADANSSSLSTGSFVRGYSLLSSNKVKVYPKFKSIFHINIYNCSTKLGFLIEGSISMKHRYFIFGKVLKGYINSAFGTSVISKIRYKEENVTIIVSCVNKEVLANVFQFFKQIEVYVDFLGSFYECKIVMSNAGNIIFKLSYEG